MSTISKLMVLTGAGFTKNFGGFLSNEMWPRVFNHPAIHENEKVRDELLKMTNFEDAYSKVLESDQFDEEERTAFKDAIEHAYNLLDEEISRYKPSSPSYFNLNHMAKLFFLLSEYAGDERALWFTLNQDLFLERHKNWRIAGAPDFQQEFYHLPLRNKPNPIHLPSPQISQAQLEVALTNGVKNYAGPAYIKLHGSYCWKSWTGEPGMVLGINKEKFIEKEPLLKCYLKVFKKALNRESAKLIIIGYGFRDAHINRLLLKAIQEHGLNLYIINPRDPE